MVPMAKMPGFWHFMYRVSPFTYFVEGMIGTAVANTNVVCAANEYLPITPPLNLTCYEYMEPYMAVAGGYFKNPNATSCEFCQLSSTNVFLASVNIKYDHRWRDWGLIWVYIIFNFFGALFLYWAFRVPHKQNLKESTLQRMRNKTRKRAEPGAFFRALSPSKSRQTVAETVQDEVNNEKPDTTPASTGSLAQSETEPPNLEQLPTVSKTPAEQPME
jgi:hypothetical protein